MIDGFDLDLVTQVRDATSLPVTVLGGAGSVSNIADLIRSFGIIGCRSGESVRVKGV